MLSTLNNHLFNKLSLVLFFVLLPYKVLGILQFNYSFRLFLSFFSFLLILKFINDIIPWFLNLILIQLLFYYCLCIENYLRQKPTWFQVFLCSCLGLNLGAWPNLSSDPTFWYLLISFVVSFYINMQKFFLNPEFEGNFYTSNKNLNLDNLNWEQIHGNMENVCLVLFKTPISNQLGASLSKKPFPEISKRYIMSRIRGAIKQNFDIIATATGVTGILGAGGTLYQSSQQHKEAMAKQDEAIAKQGEANEIAREANRIAKETKAAQDEANRIAQMQAEQAKRANDIQDIIHKRAQELDPSTNPKPKGWLWCSEEKPFFINLWGALEKFF